MGFLSLEKLFRLEVKAETEKYNLVTTRQTEHKLADLPGVLRNYITSCGYVGKEQVICCKLKWKQAALKMRPGKAWTALDCIQVNFLPQPARIVLMKAHMFGFLPFGAMDKYQDGKGSMLIRLMDFLTLSNTKGSEMDKAELVTILAETIIIPAYALLPYIHWREIDSYTFEGTIKDRGISAKGIFYFNEQSELQRFETLDRFYSSKGKFFNYPWIAYAGKFKEKGGIKFPSDFKAVWKTDQGDYTYFKGEISGIEFNSFG
jgi:hypothetical protein